MLFKIFKALSFFSLRSWRGYYAWGTFSAAERCFGSFVPSTQKCNDGGRPREDFVQRLKPVYTTEKFWHGSGEIGTGAKKEFGKFCLH